MPSNEQLMQVIQIQAEIAKLGLDLGGVMQYVVEQSLPLIGADGAVIELAEEDEMVYRAASGIAKSELGLRLKIKGSLSGLSVTSGEPQYCEDSETDSRVDRLACEKLGLRSMIVIPLKYRDSTVGVLKAMSAQPNKFQQSDIMLLNMLSEVLAATMFFAAKYDRDKLLYEATHDGMTGLGNRSLFMDRLRNAIAFSSREQRLSGLLMIDMDGLKRINDNYGHRIGDTVIKEFSNRLKSTLRDTDMAARLGGDEFGVVLTPLVNSKELDAFVSQIRTGIESPFTFEERSYPIKASIGSALVPQDGVEPEKLLEISDHRMYAFKQARKSS